MCLEERLALLEVAGATKDVLGDGAELLVERVDLAPKLQQVRRDRDDLLADLDDALGRNRDSDGVPRSRQSFNRSTAA